MVDLASRPCPESAKSAAKSTGKTDSLQHQTISMGTNRPSHLVPLLPSSTPETLKKLSPTVSAVRCPDDEGTLGRSAAGEGLAT